MREIFTGTCILAAAAIVGAALLSGCVSAQDGDQTQCIEMTGSVDAAGFWPCMQYRQGHRLAAAQAYAGAVATQQAIRSYQPQPVRIVR